MPMPYAERVQSNNPTCFVLLIDQSGSMNGLCAGEPPGGRTKAIALADAVNECLAGLVAPCAKGGPLRDYFYVALIGYGETENSVVSAFGGDLAGRDLVPVSEYAARPLSMDSRRAINANIPGAENATEEYPVWVKPKAGGNTPMCAALRKAKTIAEGWIASHPESFPPVVLNVTDGESTDGNPTVVAKEIGELKNRNDSNVLLFNLHISSKGGNSIAFPHSEVDWPDQHAKMLYDISSVVPEPMLQNARNNKHDIKSGARGFVYNADINRVVEFLDIGTIATRPRG